MHSLFIRRVICLVVFAAFVEVLGCSSNEDAGPGSATDRVVVYTSVDRIFAEPVLNAASKALGLNVVGVYDTEETKSTGLVNRLIAQKDNPDADIFWSGDPARASLLKAKGVTASYDTRAADAIDSSFKDADRHWIGFSARTRVLLVNADLVAEGQEPRSIFDLTKPEWRDRVAIANPLFGTTSFHMAALFEALGEAKAWEWLNALHANGVKIVASNGEVKREVAGGTAAVGLTDSDDAAEAMKDGQPVRLVLLDQHTPDTPQPLGTLVIPNTVSLIKDGPNPSDAKRVFDYMLSPEACKMLAESCSQAPLIRGAAIAPPSGIDFASVVPMRVDYAQAADHLDRLLPALKKWIDRP